MDCIGKPATLVSHSLLYIVFVIHMRKYVSWYNRRPASIRSAISKVILVSLSNYIRLSN